MRPPCNDSGMPELPEVETIRRQLVERLPGDPIVAAWSHPSPKFADAPLVIGSSIVELDRRGKYLIARLDDGRDLIVHLGMTGSLAVHPQAVTPTDPDPHLRASWTFGSGPQLRFRDVRRFGRIAVTERDDHRSLPTLATLGPEPLGPGFTGEHLHRALALSSRAVKTQLLSQRPVAGVGNIYADEALWAARVHPASTQVTRPQAERLASMIRHVLSEGLDHGGTTLRDYVDGNGERGGHQLHLSCYGRGGEPCERCGQPLVRGVLDGRTTTWCSSCQRRPRRRT